MELNDQNYHGQEMSTQYMGASQFKKFMKCPAEALAEIKGEIKQESTTALLVGSYVDAYFSGELEKFKKEHLEIFKKDGTLKSDYVQAEEIIKVIEDDEMMHKYLQGQHQVIMTGTIAGVPFKIKMDSYFPGKAIVDQKIMKDAKPIYVEGLGWTNFVEAWGYDIQGAIYQEIERQNSADHKKLPFILNVTTKEKVPSKYLLEVDQERLDECLEIVKEHAPIFHKMKLGEIPATECGECDYCKAHKKITGIKSYHMCDRESYN